MYSYEEYPDCVNTYNYIDAEAVLTKILEEEIKDEPKQKFKVGDWVTFNHGEYPDHFSFEPWQITHFNYDYYKEGSPMGRTHKSSGMAHNSQYLRYAHPKEIEYYLSGFPKLYNKKTKGYDLIEVFDQYNFKIGDLDTSVRIGGKQLIKFLLETNYNHGDIEFLSKEGKEIFSKILLKMCEIDAKENESIKNMMIYNQIGLIPIVV